MKMYTFCDKGAMPGLDEGLPEEQAPKGSSILWMLQRSSYHVWSATGHVPGQILFRAFTNDIRTIELPNADYSQMTASYTEAQRGEI